MNYTATLVLLGDGELMDAMKEKASNLGIKDRVTFVGNVGNANEWYQAFDCFVLPSVWEGLPVVGVEAQAADLPCIFSSAVTREIGLSERAKFISLAIYTLCALICSIPKFIRGEFGEFFVAFFEFKAAPYAWYLAMYLGLYLLIPILNDFLSNENIRGGAKTFCSYSFSCTSYDYK